MNMRTEMLRLAKQLPEHDTVHAMYGVGEITAAQNKFLRIYYARVKECLAALDAAAAQA